MALTFGLLAVTAEEFDNIVAQKELVVDYAHSRNTNFLDIDVSWAGILYILIGYDKPEFDEESLQPPLSWICCTTDNQIIVNSYNFHYYITPDQVNQVNNILQSISDKDFKKKYNIKEMTEINLYPFRVWDEEKLTFLLDNFILLKNFYKNASQKRMFVISFLGS